MVARPWPMRESDTGEPGATRCATLPVKVKGASTVAVRSLPNGGATAVPSKSTDPEPQFPPQKNGNEKPSMTYVTPSSVKPPRRSPPDHLAARGIVSPGRKGEECRPMTPPIASPPPLRLKPLESPMSDMLP